MQRKSIQVITTYNYHFTSVSKFRVEKQESLSRRILHGNECYTCPRVDLAR